jgi:hypothetical protein
MRVSFFSSERTNFWHEFEGDGSVERRLIFIKKVENSLAPWPLLKFRCTPFFAPDVFRRLPHGVPFFFTFIENYYGSLQT